MPIILFLINFFLLIFKYAGLLKNLIEVIYISIKYLGRRKVLVDKIKQQNREKICRNCKSCLEPKSKYFYRCDICKCFLILKTKLSAAGCPKNKWVEPKLVDKLEKSTKIVPV